MSVVAVAQTIPARGDVDGNVAQHVRLARIAAERQARIVVFPELSLTGYELDLAARLAFSPTDARLSPLVETAAACSLTLVVGAPVRLGSRLHIGALVLGPDRTVEVYTKHHLGVFSPGANPDGEIPPPEATVFDAGESNPLVRFAGRTAAIAICADTGRASHRRQAARRGADTYLASMFVVPPDFERESAILASFAAGQSMTVALANYGGPSGGLPAAGCSSIWSANGELLVRLEATGTGVGVATVNPHDS